MAVEKLWKISDFWLIIMEFWFYTQLTYITFINEKTEDEKRNQSKQRLQETMQDSFWLDKWIYEYIIKYVKLKTLCMFEIHASNDRKMINFACCHLFKIIQADFIFLPDSAQFVNKVHHIWLMHMFKVLRKFLFENTLQIWGKANSYLENSNLWFSILFFVLRKTISILQ